MKLFESASDLDRYLFRIVDNGGETYDRFTIMTCDGDATLASENTICTTVEYCQPRVLADEVEKGSARDLRWIDLPESVRKGFIDYLNQGFADWLEREEAADTRDEAGDYDGTWTPNSGYHKLPIYRDGQGFRIRDDENEEYNADAAGEGLFDTYREAVLYILPDEHSLAGPEYHSTVDLWDETGGPCPLWERESAN